MPSRSRNRNIPQQIKQNNYKILNRIKEVSPFWKANEDQAHMSSFQYFNKISCVDRCTMQRTRRARVLGLGHKLAEYGVDLNSLSLPPRGPHYISI